MATSRKEATIADYEACQKWIPTKAFRNLIYSYLSVIALRNSELWVKTVLGCDRVDVDLYIYELLLGPGDGSDSWWMLGSGVDGDLL